MIYIFLTFVFLSSPPSSKKRRAVERVSCYPSAEFQASGLGANYLRKGTKKKGKEKKAKERKRKERKAKERKRKEQKRKERKRKQCIAEYQTFLTFGGLPDIFLE